MVNKYTISTIIITLVLGSAFVVEAQRITSPVTSNSTAGQDILNTYAQYSSPINAATAVSAPSANSFTLLEPGFLGLSNNQAPSDFRTYAQLLFNILLGLAVMLAVMQIVYGGLQYMISAIPGSKINAKGKITGAVGGLLIALLSYLALNTINPDLVNWQLNIGPAWQITNGSNSPTSATGATPAANTSNLTGQSGQPGQQLINGQQYTNVKGTGYTKENNAMEGGPLDTKGKPLYTLQDYLAGNAPYVSVAMDQSAFTYGQKIQIPELDQAYGRTDNPINFQVVDTGSAFNGKTGTGAIDICTDNQTDAKDNRINNSNLTIIPVAN